MIDTDRLWTTLLVDFSQRLGQLTWSAYMYIGRTNAIIIIIIIIIIH
jgi:hypothetical protein